MIRKQIVCSKFWKVCKVATRRSNYDIRNRVGDWLKQSWSGLILGSWKSSYSTCSESLWTEVECKECVSLYSWMSQTTSSPCLALLAKTGFHYCSWWVTLARMRTSKIYLLVITYFTATLCENGHEVDRFPIQHDTSNVGCHLRDPISKYTRHILDFPTRVTPQLNTNVTESAPYLP